MVPWDGYLKYYNLGEKNPGLVEKRRKVFADTLQKYLEKGPSSSGRPQEPVPNGSVDESRKTR